jgi:hypothetical protein
MPNHRLILVSPRHVGKARLAALIMLIVSGPAKGASLDLKQLDRDRVLRPADEYFKRTKPYSYSLFNRPRGSLASLIAVVTLHNAAVA